MMELLLQGRKHWLSDMENFFSARATNAIMRMRLQTSITKLHNQSLELRADGQEEHASECDILKRAAELTLYVHELDYARAVTKVDDIYPGFNPEDVCFKALREKHPCDTVTHKKIAWPF